MVNSLLKLFVKQFLIKNGVVDLPTYEEQSKEVIYDYDEQVLKVVKLDILQVKKKDDKADE